MCGRLYRGGSPFRRPTVTGADRTFLPSALSFFSGVGRQTPEGDVLQRAIAAGSI